MLAKSKSFLIILFNVFAISNNAQDYFSYLSGNKGGINLLLANPAGANNGAIQLDFCAASFDLSFNNSLLAIKRDAIGFPTLPNTWQNKTPNVPNNIYKNFIFKGKKDPYSMLFEQRLMLPSVFFQIDKKQSIALICGYRQIGNIDGVSGHLADLFKNEFDLSLLQNHPFNNAGLRAIKMSWLEYGLNYARCFTLNKNQTLSAGITFKIVQGLESAYFVGNTLSYLFSTVDTNSYLTADFSLARSQGANSKLDFSGAFGNKLRNAAALQAGFDIGLKYEWKDEDASKPNLKSEETIYKLKLGMSVVDIGRIRFLKEQNYYDLNVHVTQTDVVRYVGVGSARGVDSLIKTDFPPNTGSQQFTVLLPTALNFQADYRMKSKYFVNLSAHINCLSSSKNLYVHSVSAFCLSPRYQSDWLEIALPFTYNLMSAKRGEFIMPGFTVRYGPLQIGTSDLSTAFRKNIPGIHFFAILRLSLKNLKKANQVKKWKS